MNNWYSKNNSVSPEDYRRARDSVRQKDYFIHIRIMEYNNNLRDYKIGEKVQNERCRKSFV